MFYGYATGVFSSHGIEKATYESIPLRFIAGGLHSDHDTLADFRKRLVPQSKGLLVQVLLGAQELGALKLGNIRLEGDKFRAAAAKPHAVSYKRRLEWAEQRRQEVEELPARRERADAEDWPEGLPLAEEMAFRQERWVHLAPAPAVWEARAQERYQAEPADPAAKLREREEKAQQTGRQPGDRPPQPPPPGPRDQDPYNFTDPESHLMKNRTDQGFDQYCNAPAAVDQESRMIVGCTLSAHAHDQGEALPTVEAIPSAVGTPDGATLDNGYFSEGHGKGLEERPIDPSLVTGREPHRGRWKAYCAPQPKDPGADAGAKEKRAYKLQTESGRAI